MDHKDFLANLPPQTATTLTAIDPIEGYSHLAKHLLLIIVLGSLITAGIPFWWMLLPLQGIALVFLFTLQHETTHKTPFPNQRFNETVGHATGLILFQPFLWFRYFHLAHHRFTNDPERDPELESGKPDTPMQYLLHVSGLGVWRANITQVFNNALGRTKTDYLPKSTLPRIQKEARWMLLTYALASLSLPFTPILLWVWIIPMLLGQPFLRLYLLAEHGRCAPVANMFENTRTTFTNRIVRFLAWNMPYHTEHHVYPSVPFHNLPALHNLIKDELRVTSDGYVAFTQSYANELLKP